MPRLGNLHTCSTAKAVRPEDMAKKKKRADAKAEKKPRPPAPPALPQSKKREPKSDIDYVGCLETPVGNLMRGESPGATYGDRLRRKLKPHGDCLVWTGGVSGEQGKILFPTVQSVSVHRAAWALWFGENPPALIRQTCGDPLCCAKAHLEEGAPRRRRDRGRKAAWQE